MMTIRRVVLLLACLVPLITEASEHTTSAVPTLFKPPQYVASSTVANPVWHGVLSALTFTFYNPSIGGDAAPALLGNNRWPPSVHTAASAYASYTFHRTRFIVWTLIPIVACLWWVRRVLRSARS
jgi:hypothetical protein